MGPQGGAHSPHPALGETKAQAEAVPTLAPAQGAVAPPRQAGVCSGASQRTCSSSSTDGAQKRHSPAYVCTGWPGPGPHPGHPLHPQIPAEVVWARGVALLSIMLQAGPQWSERGRRAAPIQHPVPSGYKCSWSPSDWLSWLSSALATSQGCYHECHRHGNHESGPHSAEPNMPGALRASHLPMGRATPGIWHLLGTH